MKYSNRVRAGVLLILIMLAVSGCFAPDSRMQQEAVLALEQSGQLESYSVKGQVAMTDRSDPAADLRWHWSGMNTDEQSLMEWRERTSQDEPGSTVVHDSGQLYVHLPELNQAEEYFVADIKSDSLKLFQPDVFAEPLSNLEGEAFAATDEENGTRTVTVQIDESRAGEWLAAVQQRLAMWPAWIQTFVLPYEQLDRMKASNWTENSVFTITLDDEGQLESYSLELDTDQYRLEWSQSIDSGMAYAPKLDPTSWNTIRLEDVIRQLEHLAEAAEPAAEAALEPGIEWASENPIYPDDQQRQAIVDLIEQNAQALIDRDRDQFNSTFRRETNADRHEELWQRDRQYRFLHLENLQEKTMSGTIRISVLYEYMSPGDTQTSVAGFTYYVVRDDQGHWSIDRIDG